MQRFRELAPGVLVATAAYATTTSTVITADDGECLVIDPAVSVADLAALAADLAGAGLRPRAGFATHPHWDHVLWSRDLGDVPRYAAPGAVTIAETERDAMVSGVEKSAPGHDLELFGRLVPLPADSDRVPWDGPVARVVIHDGHAPRRRRANGGRPRPLAGGDHGNGIGQAAGGPVRQAISHS